jgi:transposase InsO family protein
VRAEREYLLEPVIGIDNVIYRSRIHVKGAFTGALTTAGVRISMDGRGRWMDNVFIERLWPRVRGRHKFVEECPCWRFQRRQRKN